MLYPVTDAPSIPGYRDHGLVLFTRHVSGRPDLVANLTLYSRANNGDIRCKTDPRLQVAATEMETFSTAALADFILAAITNVSVSPMMSMMIESRGMIAEFDRIRAAGQMTF